MRRILAVICTLALSMGFWIQCAEARNDEEITILIFCEADIYDNDYVGDEWEFYCTVDVDGEVYTVLNGFDDWSNRIEVTVETGTTIKLYSYVLEADESPDTAESYDEIFVDRWENGSEYDIPVQLTITEDYGEEWGDPEFNEIPGTTAQCTFHWTFTCTWGVDDISEGTETAAESTSQTTTKTVTSTVPVASVFIISEDTVYYHSTASCPSLDGAYCDRCTVTEAENRGLLPCPVCVAEAEEETEESTAAETEPAETGTAEPEETESAGGRLIELASGIVAVIFLALFLGVPSVGCLIALGATILEFTPIPKWYAKHKEQKQLTDPTYGKRKKELRKELRKAQDSLAEEHDKMLQSQADIDRQYKALSAEHSKLQSKVRSLEMMNRAFIKKNSQLQRDLDSVLLSLDQGEGYVITTKNGNFYHRPDCPQLKGKKRRFVSVEDAQAEGMKPCKTCNPLQITFDDVL